MPFGKGIVALPHRGRHTLEMYASGQTDAPAHVFEGFTDVVTEFVWRNRGGQVDGQGMQLLFWINLR
jgi:WD repeat-containing protein 59